MDKPIRSYFILKPLPAALILTAALLLLAVLGGEKIEFLQFLELKTVDLRFLLRGPKAPSDKIVIVAVDDASIQHYGAWPWPRSRHAQMLEYLSADGAKAVGFDFIFADSQESLEQTRLRRLVQHYRSLSISKDAREGRPFGQMMRQVLRAGEHDHIFAQALKKHPTVVLPIIFQDFNVNNDSMAPHEAQPSNELMHMDDSLPPELLDALLSSDEANAGLMEPPPQITAAAFKHIIPSPSKTRFHPPQASTLLAPLREFYQNSRYVGAANAFPDIDGYQRWANMVIMHQQKPYQTFALQLVKQFNALDEDDVALVQKVGVQIGDVMVPLDKKGRLLINYYGPAYTFQYYSYAQVLEKQLPAGTFKNKLVLLGYAATGLFDVLTTPFSEAMPGVEKHASVVSNILQNDFLSGIRAAHWLTYLYIIIIGLTVGLIAQHFASVQTTALTALLLVMVFLSDYLLFRYANLCINTIYPVAAHLFLTGAVIILKYFIEEKDKRFLMATFARYITPELIQEMYTQKKIPDLGGEMRRITAFFSDIRNFSSLSEKLTAQQLVELLNEYLSAMTDILNADRGTLDKYEGDAIIAFFGAPLDLEDHALQACRVAVGMQNALGQLTQKWKQERLRPGEADRNTFNLSEDEWRPGARWPKEVGRMKMRIGVNTGDIVVGNMGSVKRMDYTMIGDAVNLASRLENACKLYGIFTLASEHTLFAEFKDQDGVKHKVIDWVEARFIDKIIVAGRQTPTQVYEIRALKGELTSSEKRLFDLFDQGMQQYRAMQWDSAIDLFKQARQHEDPSEQITPSEVFIRRCEAFKEKSPAAPGEKWNGVFHLLKK